MSRLYTNGYEVEVTVCNSDGSPNPNGSFLKIVYSVVCNIPGAHLDETNVEDYIPSINLHIRKTLNSAYEELGQCQIYAGSQFGIAVENCNDTRTSKSSNGMLYDLANHIKIGDISDASQSAMGATAGFAPNDWGYGEYATISLSTNPMIVGPINTKLSYDIKAELSGPAYENIASTTSVWCASAMILNAGGDNDAVSIGPTTGFRTEYNDDVSNTYIGSAILKHETGETFESEQKAVRFSDTFDLDTSGNLKVKGSFQSCITDYEACIDQNNGTFDFNTPCDMLTSSVMKVVPVLAHGIIMRIPYLNAPVASKDVQYFLETFYNNKTASGLQRATADDGSVYIRNFNFEDGELVTDAWISPAKPTFSISGPVVKSVEAKNVKDSTYTPLESMTFAKGYTYIVEALWYFQSNSNGRRVAGLSTTNNSLAQTCFVDSCVPSGVSRIHITMLVEGDGSTRYFNAYQSSGSTITCALHYSYIRFPST